MLPGPRGGPATSIRAIRPIRGSQKTNSEFRNPTYEFESPFLSAPRQVAEIVTEFPIENLRKTVNKELNRRASPTIVRSHP